MDVSDKGHRRFALLIKPLAFILLLACLSLGIFLFAHKHWVSSFKELVETQRRDNLSQIVSVARSAVEPIVAKVRAGALTPAEGRDEVRSLVRTMTYKDQYGSNYVFMSAYDGTMLVQPFEPDKEMTNQWDLKDADGLFIIRELVRAAKDHPTGAFVTYRYYLPGVHKTQEKLAYVVGLPELQCYIGTGMYMQQAVRGQTEILERVRSAAVWLLVVVLIPIAGSVVIILNRTRRLLAEVAIRQKTEADLRASEEKYRSIFENTVEGIFQSTPEGRLVSVNPAFARIAGYGSPEEAVREITDMDTQFYAEPGDRARYRKILEEEGVVKDHVVRLRRRDGSFVWVSNNSRLVKDSQGKVLFYEGTIEDITTQREAVEALRESEEKYRTIFEHSGSAMIFVEEDATITMCNRQFTELSGYTREEIEGRMKWTQFVANREDLARMEDYHRLRMANPKDAPTTYMAWFSLKDGAVREFMVTAAMLPGTTRSLAALIDIEEIKQAEVALRESRQRLADIIDFLPDATLVIDGEGKIITWNKAIEAMTGFSAEEMLGKGDHEYALPFYGERRPILIDFATTPGKAAEMGYTDIQKEGGVFRGETFCPMVKGAPRFLSVWASPIYDLAGNVAGAIESIRDITERKRDEEELRLNEARLETLIALGHMGNAPITQLTGFALEEGIKITASKIGYLAFMNEDETVLTMYSWSREAMAGCGVDDRPIVYPVASTGLWGEAVRQRRSVITNDYDAPSPLKKGYPPGHIPVKRHLSLPVFDGEKIVAVAGVGNKEREYDQADVRQLNLLMEGMWRLVVRRRAEDALSVERERLETLSDNAPFGMVLIDGDGRFTYINHKFTETFGYDASDIPDGKSWFRRAFPDHDYRREVIASWKKDFETPKPGVRTIRTFTATCKDGTQRIVNFSSLQLATGHTLMAAEDVTELRHLEAQLLQSRKMEAIGTLAGGVAHDFNNILTVLIGCGTLMQMGLDESSPMRVYADQVVAASQKAANLTQSLLAFSRQQAISLKPLDINERLSGAEKLLTRLITEDIALKTRMTTESAVAMADASQIDQILFNLATNARDAMPKGGTLLIETDVVDMDERFVRAHGFGEAGRYVLITVTDTGMGMDETVKDKIFDPFFTTKETGKGTGLGLATVYGIVKQHKGYITVYSEPMRGTTFRIYLPSVGARPEPQEGTASALRGGKETILIAEDNEDVRFFVKATLNQYGYTTVEAVDGEDAVDQVLSGDHIDLLILDSVMPKLNGREAYEKVRAVRPNVKVLFTSGYTKDIVLDKGIEEKEFAFLPKPISPEVLLKKVREVLDGE